LDLGDGGAGKVLSTWGGELQSLEEAWVTVDWQAHFLF
jgi:hypothetical protein